MDRPNLLTRIRAARDQDENLKTIARNDLIEYQIAKDGTILVHGRISVPNDRSLKDKIPREAHKSRFSIHPGVTKMYHILRQYYHWIRMKVDVAEWVAKCHICQLIKVEQQVLSGSGITSRWTS